MIFVSSVAAFTGGVVGSHYTASKKAALIGLMHVPAGPLVPHGVTVNAIAPGFIETEMTEQYPPGYLESRQDRIPAGRKGDPAELAATAVFLASPAAAFLTGQTLLVGGGIVM